MDMVSWALRIGHAIGRTAASPSLIKRSKKSGEAVDNGTPVEILP
jgi:hypothetical protein